MDLLGYFAFRTGVPFGYLVFLLGLLVSTGVGLRLLVRGLSARPADRGRALGGGAMLAAAVVFVAANLVYTGALELNPTFTLAEVAGEWREGSARLSLH